MKFIYSADGEIVGLRYKDKSYYYIKNLQGDVIGILDELADIVCDYHYDAWGQCTISIPVGLTDDAIELANKNPIRYRGYYYDTETELYYLQSRYYNPEWGRFVNGDNTSVLVLVTNGVTERNLYSYCDNNPVCRADDTGNVWLTTLGIMAVGGVIGSAASAIGTAVVDYAFNGTINWKSVAVSAVSGFVGGAISASPLCKGAVVAIGIVNDVLSYTADCHVNGRSFSLGDAAFTITMSVATGLWGGHGANYKLELTNMIDYSSSVIAKNNRRNNVEYAQKTISAVKNQVGNKLAVAATKEFVSGLTNSVVSNSGMNIVSRYDIADPLNNFVKRW